MLDSDSPDFESVIRVCNMISLIERAEIKNPSKSRKSHTNTASRSDGAASDITEEIMIIKREKYVRSNSRNQN